MKPAIKRAFVLLDGNDLKDFKNLYGYSVTSESLWLPFDVISMIQVVLYEANKSYYIPRIPKGDGFFITKSIYIESQKFLKQLLWTNKFVTETEDCFPLEFFWFRLWSGLYRIITFCKDFLSRHTVEEVVLIKRNKFVNSGGLLINAASFTDLVEAVFKSENTEVKILEYQKHYVKPKTIFYARTRNLKSLLRDLINFISWKTMSFNRKNYDYILVNPAYDNVINYNKFFKSPNKMSPQVFHGGSLPFLHSWRKLLNFLIISFSFKYRYSDNNKYIVSSYESNLQDFKFDFTDTFRSTIVQYLKDVRWMESYISMFWDNCLSKGKQYLVIFSLSPVHLDSYFLIRKTRKGNGRLAAWQHGGSYGYAHHFHHYITDYKNTDFFLSFGRNDITNFEKEISDKYPNCIEVGSNVIYGNSVPDAIRLKKSYHSQGLFIPVVAGEFHSQSIFKWRGDLQFDSIKQIIDYFGFHETEIVIKGLKNHKPHRELKKYVETKKYKGVWYTDIPVDRALSNNPKFVIIDNSSTPLLQVLAQYKGPVFLLVNQDSWSIRNDALNLLKRRVIYSESTDELKHQLAAFLENGDLNGTNTNDSSFTDTYIKRFNYNRYERFIKKAT